MSRFLKVNYPKRGTMGLGTYLFIGFIAFMASGLRLIFEYQRVIVFRLGKYKKTLRPGLKWIIPVIDTTKKIDIRITTDAVPMQEAITLDNVSVKIDAVVFFKVINPEKAVINIDRYRVGVSQYARTAMRDIVGKFKLDDVLAKRDKIAEEIKIIVDKATDPWGVDVISVRIQNIEMPENMKRAMARQAEADREKKAIIIKSEGEVEAAENLTKAAKTMDKHPAALHLRTLNTLTDIASDPSQKIILALPVEVLKAFGGKKK
jgi:regulator of protease activity HflC (stomatin/prohibitin superfamily)